MAGEILGTTGPDDLGDEFALFDDEVAVFAEEALPIGLQALEVNDPGPIPAKDEL